jgi:tripartite-type tricarboxylate transporter receptor subunit TctC
LIASQAPGGGVDAVARIVSSRLSEALGQTVIVDNRPGANGSVAGELAANSPPDGYTLMLGALGNLGVNVFFFKKLAYEPLKDLAPVTTAISSGNVLVVHPSVPAKSVKELIALARARPDQLAYGSSGSGGAGHLAGALFRSMAKIEMLHVPYKGGAPAMIDLLAGQVQLVFASSPTAVSPVNAGRLRALAVTTARRSKLFSELPTIAEAGVPGYEVNSWSGVIAPAGLPRPILERLNAAVNATVAAPEVKERLAQLGSESGGSTPEQFGELIRRDSAKWADVIKRTGARID